MIKGIGYGVLLLAVMGSQAYFMRHGSTAQDKKSQAAALIAAAPVEERSGKGDDFKPAHANGMTCKQIRKAKLEIEQDVDKYEELLRQTRASDSRQSFKLTNDTQFYRGALNQRKNELRTARQWLLECE